jgi:hypothetical protein
VDPVRLATCLDRSVAASGAIASTVTPCLPWRKLLSGEVGWNGISAACRLGPFGAAVVPPPSPGGPTLRQWQIEAEVVEFDADRNSGAQARLDRPVDKRRASERRGEEEARNDKSRAAISRLVDEGGNISFAGEEEPPSQLSEPTNSD